MFFSSSVSLTPELTMSVILTLTVSITPEKTILGILFAFTQVLGVQAEKSTYNGVFCGESHISSCLPRHLLTNLLFG